MSPSKTPKSHAETFVFFVLGQRDDGIRVTSEYAAFHKVPSRGALQSRAISPREGERFYLQILMPQLPSTLLLIARGRNGVFTPYTVGTAHMIGPPRRRLGLFRGGTMIATDGVGPPGPEMRSPSWKLGRRGVPIERAAIGTYPASAQLSSESSRLASRHSSPRKEDTCR